MNGRLTVAANTYAEILRLSDNIKIDTRHIARRQAEIVQSLAAWEEIIAGRLLHTIDTLEMINERGLTSLPESLLQLKDNLKELDMHESRFSAKEVECAAIPRLDLTMIDL